MNRADDIFERIVTGNESTIDDFIRTRQTEELFLDFKRSADNGAGRNLHQNDRENLAKAISGFGNSEGGVIIWGVDCSRDHDGADVAHTKIRIQNPERFASWLEGVVSGCTVPPHSGVRHHSIKSQADNKGFVISYIPKSNASPHQALPKLQYFMRAGSSFSPVPHTVLAGMFGRRPQPEIFANFVIGPPRYVPDKNTLSVEIDLVLVNRGPGIASDLFMNLWVVSGLGQNSRIWFDGSDQTAWTVNLSLGTHVSVVSKPGQRLPPRAQLHPIAMHIALAPPFSKDLKIDGMCGCGQAPPFRFAISKESFSVKTFYEEFSNIAKSRTFTEDDDSRAGNLLGTWFGKSLDYDPYG